MQQQKMHAWMTPRLVGIAKYYTAFLAPPLAVFNDLRSDNI
jgi:hypothetical protein